MTHEQPFIPFHVPVLEDEEIQEVVATLRSGWLTTGPRTQQFEKDFCVYTGARHALALNSGTAAMHLALAALGIGPGDEVITTPITFCATVNCILHVGATPVLADIGPDGNIDPASIAERITPRTRAIMPVHYAGMPCDMDAIWSLAAKHNLKVVEDAAHAVGTHYHGSHLGDAMSSRSDAVAFSFYATKNMTTGEGGMVTTSNADLDETMRKLALHGINKDAWNRYAANGKWYYSVDQPGFKYNLTDIASALGIHQLQHLEGYIARRAELVRLYNELFQDVTEVEVPGDTAEGRHAWHLYVLRLNLDRLAITRNEFIEELRVRGIGVSVHFIPIPLHPFYKKWANLPEQQCPRGLEFYGRIISLPLHPALSDQEIHRIADTVKEVACKYSKPVTTDANSAVIAAA